MAETSTKLYEGLFLLNQRAAASDFNGCVRNVQEILDRAQAKVVSFCKWDDRKLAYDINGQKRGTFCLVIFEAETNKIIKIERDCNLSEQVLRAMITRADHLGEAELELAQKNTNLEVELKLREQTTPPVSDTAPASTPAEAVAETS